MLFFMLLIGKMSKLPSQILDGFEFDWPRRESLAEQVSKLRRSCAVKEAEVAKAKDDERPFGMKG